MHVASGCSCRGEVTRFKVQGSSDVDGERNRQRPFSLFASSTIVSSSSSMCLVPCTLNLAPTNGPRAMSHVENPPVVLSMTTSAEPTNSCPLELVPCTSSLLAAYTL